MRIILVSLVSSFTPSAPSLVRVHIHRTMKADSEGSSTQVEAFLASLGNQLYTADANVE